MLYALCWVTVAALLALWSLTAWVAHAAVLWALSNAGGLSGAGAQGLHLPEWLAAWVPPEIAPALTAMVSAMAAGAQQLLDTMPWLASALTAASWAVWGVGSVLIVLAGTAAHLLVAWWHGRSRAQHRPPLRLPAAR